MSVMGLPRPPKPDGTDADREHLSFLSIAIGRRNNGAGPNRRKLKLLSKKIDLFY